jgi:TatD DNase family protein
MIDFHCHLDLYPDPQEVVSGCVRRNLYVLSVTTTPSAWRGTSRLVAGAGNIRVALGLHPELAAERKHELDLFDALVRETRYIGEIGLDGTPAFQKFWADQVYVFE